MVFVQFVFMPPFMLHQKLTEKLFSLVFKKCVPCRQELMKAGKRPKASKGQYPKPLHSYSC